MDDAVQLRMNAQKQYEFLSFESVRRREHEPERAIQALSLFLSDVSYTVKESFLGEIFFNDSQEIEFPATLVNVRASLRSGSE